MQFVNIAKLANQWATVTLMAPSIQTLAAGLQIHAIICDFMWVLDRNPSLRFMLVQEAITNRATSLSLNPNTGLLQHFYPWNLKSETHY